MGTHAKAVGKLEAARKEAVVLEVATQALTRVALASKANLQSPGYATLQRAWAGVVEKQAAEWAAPRKAASRTPRLCSAARSPTQWKQVSRVLGRRNKLVDDLKRDEPRHFNKKLCAGLVEAVMRCALAMLAVKQKTAYEIRLSLVGSEMCIRDSHSCSRSWRAL